MLGFCGICPVVTHPPRRASVHLTEAESRELFRDDRRVLPSKRFLPDVPAERIKGGPRSGNSLNDLQVPLEWRLDLRRFRVPESRATVPSATHVRIRNWWRACNLASEPNGPMLGVAKNVA